MEARVILSRGLDRASPRCSLGIEQVRVKELALVGFRRRGLVTV